LLVTAVDVNRSTIPSDSSRPPTHTFILTLTALVTCEGIGIALKQHLDVSSQESVLIKFVFGGN